MQVDKGVPGVLGHRDDSRFLSAQGPWRGTLY